MNVELLASLISDLEKVTSNYEYINAFYPTNTKAKREKLAHTMRMANALRKKIENAGVDIKHSVKYFSLELDED